jgi:glycosyltransferase involved in cell wall biosynthesis
MMKVSVHMLAYNHERYIAQALDSALAQKTNFDFEIVVGEDCSPDSTRRIVEDYASRYPNRVRLVLHESNVGMHRNLVDTLKACSGQYVAFMEGDDFWTSEDKLQRQVDFLDHNPDFVTCSHPVRVINSNGQQLYITKSDPRQNVSLRQVIEYRYPLPTCGVMIRKGMLSVLPPWFYKVHNCDYAIQLLLARHGSVHYMADVMGTYRKHSGGVSASTSLEYQVDKLIFLFRKVIREIDPVYHSSIRRRLAFCHRSKSKYAFQRRDLRQTLTHAAMCGWLYASSLLR